jgi:hypothetical protein
MGRPIKKKYIGDQKNNPQTHYIVCTAWPVGASGAVACTILKQKSSNRYKVTDGTHTSVCKLVTGTPLAAGQMSITVDPYVVPTGLATFTVTMEVNTATLVTPGGTGTAYNPGDILTVVGGTGTSATITVNTVSAGGVATFTLTTKGSYTALPVNPVSVTDATTPGATPSATFNLKYDVKSIAVGGTNTGYGVNTELQIVGGGFATQATATTVVTSGHIGTPTIGSNGTGYTSIPTVTALSFDTAQYANKINNRTVETFQDHKYKWELDVQSLTGAGTPNGPTSQGVQTLGEALIQSN